MIRVENLSVEAGEFRLQGISFEVPAGEYAVLMGKTGSGKTTLLEGLCGLRSVRDGRVMMGDRDVTRLKPALRGIGFVPQDGALFSTMSVQQNLAFPLEIRRWLTGDIARRTGELAELLGIARLLDRGTAALSGGEAQRVALGRALAFHPKILMLDEPLSALDDETRLQMYDLLKRVQQVTGVTALHITHNVEEARQLADRFFRLESSRVFEDELPQSAEQTHVPGSFA